MIRKLKTADKIGETIIYTFLILASVITMLPFMQMITISLSTIKDINTFGFHIIPKHIDISGYQLLLGYSLIWNGYLNTIIRVLVGTSLSVLLTTLGAYALSKKKLPNRNLWTGIIVFTMYFSGGLIPSYMLVKSLGLRNTLFALVLPGAINAFSLIITRNFFMSLPESLEESARIDGANDIYILFKIIIPISKAILATITLWYGIGQWNAWLDCMLYMDNQKSYVLQLVIRQILLQGQVVDSTSQSFKQIVSPENMKMAAVVVATIPILCVYPFFQKYFVKGVMMGSLKG
jgi:putative aldouronate transport system permease protein